MNGQLLQTGEEISQDACVNSCIPSPIQHALPSFKPMSCGKGTWQDLTGVEFSAAIDDAYLQIVHYRKNLFKVPSGASGKRFVAELLASLTLLPWSLRLKLSPLRLL